MMSVLFIGPQDFVLAKYCKDHPEFIVGIGAGMIVALLVVFVIRGGKKSEEEYEPVTMSELKAKALD